MERRLAAVLAADVAGYASMMERDEAGAFARVRRLRDETLAPSVAGHGGRIFKDMGDGFLAEFGSVVAAVSCAVAIQRDVAARDAATPITERVALRIGVTLGDVIVDGADLQGEGVNIAARLQALAEPGGIWVDQSVVDQLSRKLPLAFVEVGAVRLKNIEKLVRVHRALLGGEAAPAAPRRRGAALKIGAAVLALAAAGAAVWSATRGPERPAVTAAREVTLAVLPFDDLSPDASQRWLADGLAADLTVRLARLPGLFVVSSEAAAARGDAEPDAAARALGVAHLLTGGVQRAGETIRVTATLTEAATGRVLWGERYEGPFAEVVAVQDRVAGSVAEALSVRLVDAPRAAALPGFTEDAEAYALYLEALAGWETGVVAAAPEMRRLLEQAGARDPDFGAAHAELALLYLDAAYWRELAASLGVDRETALRRAAEHEAASARRPSSNLFHLRGYRFLARERRIGEAVEAYGQAVGLDPSDWWAQRGLATALAYAGRADEAAASAATAERLDPRGGVDQALVSGLALFASGRDREAVAALRRWTPEDPRVLNNGDEVQRAMLLWVAAAGHTGDAAAVAEAEARIAAVRAIDPWYVRGGVNGLLAQAWLPFQRPEDRRRLLEGVLKAGAPALPFDLDPASPERLAGEKIRALLFGRTIEGRQLAPEAMAYRRTTEADGRYELTLGSDSITGILHVEGDAACAASSDGGNICFVIYRNSEGSRATQDEYNLYSSSTARIMFSPVE